MNKNKNILIVGYPKSGTNWLSRLVAEVLQCNFNGDWGFDTKNASRLIFENTNSEYQVFKSHHFFSDIKTASKEPIYKIIYIVRDPRDIVISGTYFFNFNVFFKHFTINIYRIFLSKNGRRKKCKEKNKYDSFKKHLF